MGGWNWLHWLNNPPVTNGNWALPMQCCCSVSHKSFKTQSAKAINIQLGWVEDRGGSLAAIIIIITPGRHYYKNAHHTHISCPYSSHLSIHLGGYFRTLSILSILWVPILVLPVPPSHFGLRPWERSPRRAIPAVIIIIMHIILTYHALIPPTSQYI